MAVVKQNLIKIFVFVLSLIPFRLSRFVIYALGSSFVSRSKDYFYLRKNVEDILKYPPNSNAISEFIKKNILHFISTTLELLRIICFNKKISMLGLEDFQRKIKKIEKEGDKSFFLVTAHIGNWELVGHYTSVYSRNTFYALAKPSRSLSFTFFLQWLREKLKMKVLWTGKNNFQKKLIQTLKVKGVIAFLVDQKPNQRQGPMVDFLGKKTPFVKGPAQLSLKYKKPLLIAFCLRRGAYTYELVSDSLSFSEISNLKVEDLCQLFAQKIEDVIKKNPEQWVWSYKRWKD